MTQPIPKRQFLIKGTCPPGLKNLNVPPPGGRFLFGPELTPTEGFIFKATVYGELASKSNQRKLVMFGKGPHARPAIIKSQKARDYVKGFLIQTATLVKPSWLKEGEMVLTAHIFYASQRPDLDCALLQDCIQEAGIVTNDRQFRELHIFHGIDKVRPRVEFEITPRQAKK